MLANPRGTDKELEIPADILANLRSICGPLPEAYEEKAWVGLRWVVGKKTFAHVLSINDGWPPAYARAAAENGPVYVLTFRSRGRSHEPPEFNEYPFFRPIWFPDIVGLIIDDGIEWPEVGELLVTSYCVLAPKRLINQLGER
jgi:hypothetical protein